MTTRLEGNNGKLERLHATKVTFDRGRVEAVPGSEESFPVDLLILAMGFCGPDASALGDELGIALDRRGNIATDASFATDLPGVFAAGDARRGQSLVVWAIAEGREAARAIDTHLRGRASVLPARGNDCPFGGR
jgi:glutamate synthase (NADPH/NADH) small chain